MKTVVLTNGIIHYSCKTIWEIYEPIMRIAYGLKRSIMFAAS